MTTQVFRTYLGCLALAGSVIVCSFAEGAMISFQEDVTDGGAYQAGAGYIDNNSPTSVFDNASVFVGAITPTTRTTRALLSYDLSSIPSGAVINSVVLKMTVTSGDGGSVDEDHTVTLHEVTTPFIEAEATWNESFSGNAWTTAGGDFNATVLSSVTANPSTIAEDDVLTFSSSAGLVSLAQGISDADGTIYLMLDSDSNSDDNRGLYRLRGDDLSSPNPALHPELIVEFTAVPEPASWLMMGTLVGLAFCRAKLK